MALVKLLIPFNHKEGILTLQNTSVVYSYTISDEAFTEKDKKPTNEERNELLKSKLKLSQSLNSSALSPDLLSIEGQLYLDSRIYNLEYLKSTKTGYIFAKQKQNNSAHNSGLSNNFSLPELVTNVQLFVFDKNYNLRATDLSFEPLHEEDLLQANQAAENAVMTFKNKKEDLLVIVHSPTTINGESKRSYMRDQISRQSRNNYIDKETGLLYTGPRLKNQPNVDNSFQGSQISTASFVPSISVLRNLSFKNNGQFIDVPYEGDEIVSIFSIVENDQKDVFCSVSKKGFFSFFEVKKDRARVLSTNSIGDQPKGRNFEVGNVESISACTFAEKERKLIVATKFDGLGALDSFRRIIILRLEDMDAGSQFYENYFGDDPSSRQKKLKNRKNAEKQKRKRKISGVRLQKGDGEEDPDSIKDLKKPKFVVLKMLSAEQLGLPNILKLKSTPSSYFSCLESFYHPRTFTSYVVATQNCKEGFNVVFRFKDFHDIEQDIRDRLKDEVNDQVEKVDWLCKPSQGNVSGLKFGLFDEEERTRSLVFVENMKKVVVVLIKTG